MDSVGCGASFRRVVAWLLVTTLTCPWPAVAAPPGASSTSPQAGETAESSTASDRSHEHHPGCHGHHPTTCAQTLDRWRYPRVSVAQKELWPPDLSLVNVGLQVDPGRACRGRADVDLAVYSDEPNEVGDDGATIRDAQLDGRDLYLRRKRDDHGNGRVYLVVATASHEGSSSRGCATVVVPRSRGRLARWSVHLQAKKARLLCELGHIPSWHHRLLLGSLTDRNEAPVVDAGADHGIDFGAAAWLDGTVEDDGLPSGQLDTSWRQVTGPGEVSFSNASAADTAATFSVPGVYVLELTATDGELSASDEVTVVVQAQNAAPVVNAGADLTLTLPQTSTTLEGEVTDDGRPWPSPTLTWSQLGGPGEVVFVPPSSAVTQAAFPGEGVFDLRLTAFDGQLSSSDDVRVTVLAEPPPVVDAEDGAVTEGNEGLVGASLEVRLSKPWPRPVAVDYVTADRTATDPCDYRRRYGTLEFAPGETAGSVLVPVVGDHLAEGDEEASLLLGNPVEATLGKDTATLDVLDDDGPNLPPSRHTARAPFDGAAALGSAPTLRWSSSDPDAGDSVTHDLFLGTSFATTGQQWIPVCAIGGRPEARWGAVGGYDEANDRLIAYGGDTPAGPAGTDLFLLENASGTGGAPGWQRLAVTGAGPGPLVEAGGAYSAATNRLVVFGGCAGSCDAPSGNAWALLHANGLGGPPEWVDLSVSGPAPRFGQATAYDAAGDQLFVFGGATGDPGETLGDLWVLEGAGGAAGTPVWREIAVTSDRPSARVRASLSYDGGTGGLVLFGGRDGAGNALGDVWVLRGTGDAHGAAWTALSPSGDGPAARFGHAAAFDPASRRLVVHGGSTAGLGDGTNYVFADVWLLTEATGDGASEWVSFEGGTVAPVGRLLPLAALDEGSGRLIVAGGANNKLASPPDDLWLLSDAVGQLPLAEAGLTDPSHVATDAGTGEEFFWRVVTRDTRGAWRGSPVWRFTTNAPPAVEAGADAVVDLPPGTLELAAVVDDDGLPVGSALELRWSQVEGPGTTAFADPTSPTTTATFDLPGLYVLRLAAGDSQLETSDEVVVEVRQANQAPTVSAGPDLVGLLPGAVATLAGSAADDGRPSGALTLAWSQVTGPVPVTFVSPDQAVTDVVVPAVGTYVLRLTASDGELSAADEVRVDVPPVNHAPFVSAGPDRGLRAPSNSLLLEGTVSDDGLPAGTLEVLWSVVDGPGIVAFDEPERAVATATFDTPGTYVLRLSATDGVLAASDEVTVFFESSGTTVDLVVPVIDVGGVVVDPRTLEMSGETVVQIANTGEGTAAGPFTVTVFEDQDQDGAFTPGTDTVLGQDVRAGLAPGSSENLPMPVAGSVRFAGNLVYAFVDSGLEVPELDETNNSASSSPGCGEPRSSDDWNVTVEWAWTSTDDDPASTKVLSAPLVLDVDGDAVPDVVFVSHGAVGGVTGYAHKGRLRAVSGRDGHEIWSVTDDALALSGATKPAAGDIDGDGRPEILATGDANANRTLFAFEHDGTPRWTAELIVGPGWGGLSIADLDGDGSPEIIVGRQAFSHEGALLWTGPPPGPGGQDDPNSLVVDLDLDGLPEVLFGNTAYRAQGPDAGQVLWQNTEEIDGVRIKSGFNGVGNLDADPEPEIVLVTAGWVFVLEHDGSVKWGPSFLEPVRIQSHLAGPPTLADFDGDGALEIAVAGTAHLVVFEADGTVVWRAPNEDSTPFVGIAAFDFDGDGAAELVHGAHGDMVLYRGSDGVILFRDEHGSGTVGESPVVADVDGDGEAEVVSVTNAYFSQIPPGVRVYGEANGRWPSARTIWNQFAYSVTNVNDDATIPAREQRDLSLGHRWAQAGSVDGGTHEPLCAFPQPDLTASAFRLTSTPAEWQLTARIGNGGARVVGPEVAVSFYDGDPRRAGARLGEAATTTYLHPGEYEEVTLVMARPRTTRQSVFVSADDSGGLRGRILEANEENNLYDTGEALTGSSGAPDLTVVDVDGSALGVDARDLDLSGVAAATVRNQAAAAVTTPFEVAFFEDRDGDGALGPADAVLGQTTLDGLGAFETVEVTAALAGALLFRGSPVHAFVDRTLVVAEADEANNVARAGETCQVRPSGTAWSLQEEWAWAPSSLSWVTATPVVGDIDGDGVPDVVFPARSGSSTTLNGRLMVVSGRDGGERVSVVDPAYELSVISSPAIGDLDGDGRPEIVAVAENQRNLLAFEADGTFLWRSDSLELAVSSGAPFLADLDGDGAAEILMGRQVLNGDGTLRWTGTGSKYGRYLSRAVRSIAADLDLDGTPEVIVGPSAYDAAGTLLWTAPIGSDGPAAVGNFDRDPYPEILVVAGTFALLDHDGTVIWNNPDLPGVGNLSPVTVADFDGDGLAEIAVGQKRSLHLLEGYGHLRWSIDTEQADTLNTGGAVSAFDLDGDGAAEIVYADTEGVHILRGRDGAELGTGPGGTCNQGHSYPVVADLDGDGKAEILVGSNDACGSSPVVGLRAYGEASDGWVRSRAVWNQYEYTLGAIEDDLTMPWPAAPGWQDDNTWRANAATSGSVFAAADVTASYVRRAEEGADLRFTVRIGNAGVNPAPAGIPVSVYNGDPRLGYPLLATAATAGPLAPGAYEDVDFVLPSTTAGDAPLAFVADDDGSGAGTLSECDEENNLVDSGFWLNTRPAVDAGDDQATELPDATVLLEGTAEDDGLPLGEGLTVTWFYGAGPVPRELIGEIFADKHALTTTATLPVAGTYRLGLTASDGRLSNEDSVFVTVHRENQAPVVSAGADQVVTLPTSTVALAGTASDDGRPAGSTLSALWSVVSGAGGVVFADPTAPATTATLAEAGTYVLRLTGTDGVLETSDEVTVVLETPNEAPVVSAGPDQRVLALAATLAGSVSDDGKPAAGTLTSGWSVVSGPGTVTFADPADPATGVAFAVPGVYVLRLTASDGEREASDEVAVNADPANQPPAVDAGPDQAVSSPRATLLGAVADDGLPVGGALTFAWSQVAGPAAAVVADPGAVMTEVVFGAEGSYVFQLTASDTELQASDTVSVTVAFVNGAPVVEAGPDAAVALPADALALQGAAADDGLPLGVALEAAWRVVSGPAPVVFDDAAALQTTARFTDPGTYVLRLRVSDGEQVGEDVVTVVVQATTVGGAAPVAVLSFPAPGTRLTAPADVTGTAESPSLASWQLEQRLEGEDGWTRFASGTEEVTDDVLGRFDPSLLLNGVHEVRLSVTDTDGRIARASTRVVVRDQMKVGHFTVSFVDLEVPVAGLPVRVTRTYDSRDKGEGDFGHGWRMDLANVRVNQGATLGLAWYGSVSGGAFASYCLQPTVPPVVTLTFPGGRVQEFEMRVTPQCQSFTPIKVAQVSFVPVGPTLGRLDIVGSPTVEIVGSWPGPVQLFNTGYSLLDPRVYRYTSPDGQVFVVDREDGLKSLTDRAGNVLTMTPAGISSKHPDVPGSEVGIAFERDLEGRITRVLDPDGQAITYEYDASGDLVAVTDREDHTTSFRYLWEPAHYLETIDDPLGRTPIRNEYDETGRLVAHIDAFGNRIDYTHDVVGRQEIVRDRNGDQRVLEYDSRGNVLRETDPKGKIVDRTYDARNNRLTETEPYDPANPPDPIPTTRYAYDDQDNLLSVEDPLGNGTSYTYNTFRQVLSTTDARGNPTTNAYDAKGNLLSTQDALGNVSAYSYDTRGNVLTQTVTVDGVDQVTSYEYDPAGRLEQETDATGHETAYTYDRTGNRLTQTTTRTTPAGPETLVTSYEYDSNGRLTGTTDPDGAATETVYDALGRQVESIDKLSRTTGYDYDEMGRLTRTTYPDSTFEEHGYDPEGRRTSYRDRANRTTTYEYDSLGRLVKTVYPDATFTENVYDDAGRLVETRDAEGNPSVYEYDSAGRRMKVRDALGHETLFTYDANGNQQTVTDARGNTVTYEYDALNRRTRTLFPPAGPAEPVTFTETAYDELGRRTSETDQAGQTTTFEYDALGRLTAVIDALDQRTTYTYDDLGNRLTQTDANSHTTSFEYDTLGRQTARILPDDSREEMAYDPAGNLETRTDFMGRLTTYAYDVNNRLLSRTYPNPAENVAFTYTPTGRRLTATDARGTTTYDYDARDRLENLTYPDGRALSYDYDNQGNRTKLTAILTAASLVSSYTFDPLSRLDTVTDPAGRAYTHAYDDNGNRASLVHPNGVETAYTYDTLNRLTSLATTHPGLSRTIQTYAFTLGPAGNRTRIVEAQGLPQERSLDYTYDALYRLTGETVTEPLGLAYAKTFAYDPVGNRLTQTTALGPAGSPGPHLQDGTLAYGYDTRDRLETEQLDALPATAYAWDANGNLTSKDAEATYTWDHENRLIRVTKTDGTLVEHLYDVDGNRVRTSVTPPAGPTTTTHFLVDTSGGLSHVVAETDGTATLQAYYVRGDDLLAVMRPLVPAPATATDWQTRYFHADGLGSIRRLTDEAANITDGYTYSAFGELLAHSGTDPQPCAFTGEPLDPNSGFQYHRARWMDPGVGRFVAGDSFAGAVADPGSLHRYLYAAASPIDHTDPLGLFTLPTFSVGTMVRSALSSMAVSVPFNALNAAVEVSGGASVGAAAQEAAFSIATDVLLGGVLLGAVKYAPRIVRLQGLTRTFRRARESVWRLDRWARGLEIERRILGTGRWLPDGFPIIDDWTRGVATSIKSLDLTAVTYQSRSQLMSRLTKYARDMAQFATASGGGVRVPPPGQIVQRRVLVIAFEDGAATADQAYTLAEFARRAKHTWPNLDVILTFVP